MGFLTNLIKVYPTLARRPLYLNGESYAGMYIVSLHVPPPRLFSDILLALHYQTLLRDEQPSCQFSQDRYG